MPEVPKSRIVEPPMVIVRHSAPNMYDHAPQGTECRVIKSEEVYTYRQMSPEEDKPRWELVNPYTE